MTIRKIAVAPWSAILIGLFLSAAMTPPVAATTIPITNYRGAWLSTATYGAGAVVTFGGASYICLVGNSGVEPGTSTADWAILDAPGVAGAAGPAGPAGPAGATGGMGPAGSAGPAGPVGPTGAQGSIGNTGAAGTPGAAGAQGPQGLQGSTGPAGAAGVGLPTNCTSFDVAEQYNGAWTCSPSQMPLYVRNGDGTVTDKATGLMWEVQTVACTGEVTCYTNSYDWSSTADLADGTLFTIFIAGLNGGDYYSPSQGQIVNANTNPLTCFANHCDWRIPTLAELNSLVELYANGCNAGASCIDIALYPTQASPYWSSSAWAGAPSSAWTINFYDGSVLANSKIFGVNTAVTYARAVRAVP